MDTVICVAAGLSSRMGNFKPLLPLGEQSIVRTLIAHYKAAGIQRFIMITGHNGDLLEDHVKDLGIICCRNERFAESDMFQSVKIGIRTYLDQGEKNAADDRILITPCDIPLVKTSTVAAVLDAPGDVCIPTVDGKKGHPLCLSSRILEQILAFEGDNGLQGALKSLGIEATKVPVDDWGSLLDADTPQDYERLLELFRSTEDPQ